MSKDNKQKQYKDFSLTNGKNSLDSSILKCIEACKYVYLFPDFWINFCSGIQNLNRAIILTQHKLTLMFWNQFCIAMRDVIRLTKKILFNNEKYEKVIEYINNTIFLKFFLRDLTALQKYKIKIRSVLSFSLHNYSEDEYGVKGSNASWNVMENEMKNLFFSTKYDDTKKELIGLINLFRSIDYDNNHYQLSETIDYECVIFDFLYFVKRKKDEHNQ